MIFLDTFRNGSDMKCCQSNVDYKNFQKYTMHIKVQSCTKRNLWKRNRCKTTDFKRKMVFFHSERVPQLKMSYTEKLKGIHTLFSRFLSSAYNYIIATEERKNLQKFSFLKNDDKSFCFTLRFGGLAVVLLQSVSVGAIWRVRRLSIGSSNRGIA